MDKRVLIVHPNSDMIVTIVRFLDEMKSQHYRLTCATTAMEAEQSFPAAEPVDLVITAVEIPEGTKPSVGAGEQCRRGLELVRRFRALSPGLATILVFAGQLDNELFAFTQSECCGLVVEGKGFQENLTNEIIKHVGPHKPEAPSRVNLEINLSTEPGYSYYQFQPEGQLPGKSHPLTVTPSVLKELVDKSRRIEESLRVDIDNPAWKEELRRLGENLANELFWLHARKPGVLRRVEQVEY